MPAATNWSTQLTAAWAFDRCVMAGLMSQNRRGYAAVPLKPVGRRGIQGVQGRNDPVTCRAFADFLMDYLSAELPPEARAEFERHIEICENCQRYLKSYEETVRLGKRAFDDQEG